MVILYPSTTVISGPGGSGKPLIGLAIAYDWLKNGGNVIFIPLQYPDMKFVRRSFEKLYSLDVKEYEENIAYVKFNPEMERTRKKEGKTSGSKLIKTRGVGERPKSNRKSR